MIVNPLKWFSQRRLDNIPPHFTRCFTPVQSDDAHSWVLSSLTGRYVTATGDTGTFMFTSDINIYFEDPAEAMLYELRWSGGK